MSLRSLAAPLLTPRPSSRHWPWATSALVVAATGFLVSAAVSAADALEPGHHVDVGSELRLLLLIPVLFVGFWWISSWMINRVTRSADTSFRGFASEAALATTTLSAFGLVRLLQSVVDALTGTTDSTAVIALGFLEFVIAGVFVIALSTAICTAYSVQRFAAVALALLPISCVYMLGLIVVTVVVNT